MDLFAKQQNYKRVLLRVGKIISVVLNTHFQQLGFCARWKGLRVGVINNAAGVIIRSVWELKQQRRPAPAGNCAPNYSLVNPLCMLRTLVLFLMLLGACATDMQPASAARRPIHRHRPMAGDFRPVYRYYRGPGRHKDRFRKFSKRRSTTHGGFFSRQGHKRRGTL